MALLYAILPVAVEVAFGLVGVDVPDDTPRGADVSVSASLAFGVPASDESPSSLSDDRV